jgi:hypothetical protein
MPILERLCHDGALKSQTKQQASMSAGMCKSVTLGKKEKIHSEKTIAAKLS